jgi:hypothetical protein
MFEVFMISFLAFRVTLIIYVSEEAAAVAENK